VSEFRDSGTSKILAAKPFHSYRRSKLHAALAE
jgi:hypothetical protein